MRIRVEFDGKSTKVSPDPANVPLADTITWEFRCQPGSQWVHWRIYFSGPSPFVQFGSVPVFIRRHAKHGQFTTPPATLIGNYKYGVEVTNSEGEVLSDDDPYLIVR